MGISYSGDNWYSLCRLLPWGVSSLFLAPFSFKGERLPCIKKLIFSYWVLGQLSSKVQHTNSLSSSTGQSSVFQACIMWVVSVLQCAHEVKCVVCFKDAVQYHAQVIRMLFMWLYFYIWERVLERWLVNFGIEHQNIVYILTHTKYRLPCKTYDASLRQPFCVFDLKPDLSYMQTLNPQSDLSRA